MPGGEPLRIIGACICATNERAEESEKTNEQCHMNLASSFRYSTFLRLG